MTHVTDTVPYPWPYDGADSCGVDRRLALVVCGAQRHWLAIDGDGQRRRRRGRCRLRLGWSTCAGVGALVVWIRTGRSAAGRRPIDRTLPVVGSATGRSWPTRARRRRRRHAGLRRLLRSRARRRAAGRGASTASLLGGFGTEVDRRLHRAHANDRGYECLVLTDACAPLDADTGAAAPVTASDDVGRHLRCHRHRRPLLAALERPAIATRLHDRTSPDRDDQSNADRRGRPDDDRTVTADASRPIPTPGPTTGPSTRPAPRWSASTGRSTSAGRAATSTPWATT